MSTSNMTPEQVAATHPSVPRIVVTDNGQHWSWTGENGARHSRPKTMPPLPALHTETSNARSWQRSSRDTHRTVLLLPPTT